MEPSLGGWAKGQDDAREKIADGFRNGVGRTLQFCIDTYLCRNGETWYLTDLAKGAMLTKSPDAGSMEKYKAWYPLLEKELALVAKSDARVIAIGRTVDGFLNGFPNKAKLCGRVYAGWIPHYSTQVAGQRGKMIKLQREGIREFRGKSARFQMGEVGVDGFGKRSCCSTTRPCSSASATRKIWPKREADNYYQNSLRP